ncbi:hypothetical protein UFOVP1328_44 [uncultured Caudovirales phage]|uniref:Uncharacterized protein n=1 Tax=uncultured Caudovirales phage TaxID=2100421 RepID=A0A6J5QNG1_9CAUD|nr:hypothetical protein UFOVP1084_34 [uncultured Caudovirales phage]CAB4199446.1 hypothetical protein UFOVP1328_44 [uncultured Caudovirales phage]CAB5228291.1 hypothetical protein UFOVP1532_12 [uncultured Caudovirales phage]
MSDQVQLDADGNVCSVILDTPVSADHPLAVNGAVDSGPNTFDHYKEDAPAPAAAPSKK